LVSFGISGLSLIARETVEMFTRAMPAISLSVARLRPGGAQPVLRRLAPPADERRQGLSQHRVAEVAADHPEAAGGEERRPLGGIVVLFEDDQLGPLRELLQHRDDLARRGRQEPACRYHQVAALARQRLPQGLAAHRRGDEGVGLGEEPEHSKEP